MQSRYSVVQWAALVTAVLPTIAAWMLVDTLDYYPYFLCAGVGLSLAFAARGPMERLRVRLQKQSAEFVAGEVAPEHAPVSLPLWVAAPLWSIALGLFANAFLDASPPHHHPSEMLRRTHPPKGPGRVVLRGYRPDEPEISIHANHFVVMGLSPAQPVTLVVRDGALGWNRIEAINPR